MKTIDMLYRALEKSAYEEYSDRFADLGVDAKSDETAVDRERKRKKKSSGFFSPAVAATLAGLVGAGGAVAATEKGRDFYKALWGKLKEIKGRAENQIAKPINEIRKSTAPKHGWGDWALLPGVVGVGAGGALMARAWGPLGPISHTSGVVGHLERLLDKDKIPETNVADRTVISNTIRDLNTKVKDRDYAYQMFGKRGPRIHMRNRHILDRDDIQRVLKKYDDIGGNAVLEKSKFKGYMGPAKRRIVGGTGAGLAALGLGWSAVNAARNYEKMKGRAH